jgi:two-component system CheB/CheR fusion protein
MTGKILVIDDEKSIGELIQLAMQAKGHVVEYATNGCDGISLFGRFGPDVVLVDKRLPDMDGIEVARQIKQTPAGKRSTLILMTGDMTERDMDRSIFSAAIEKPVSMSRLASLIEGALNVSTH